MKISNALKKTRLLRNELIRKIKIRSDNFIVVIPKKSKLTDETNYIKFEDITKDILSLMNEISVLRGDIQKTNINTIVEIGNIQKTNINIIVETGKKVSLSMLKLMIDDIRSELAQLTSLRRSERLFGFDRRRIMKTEEEEKEIAQLTDLELEETIKILENQKVEYENILEYTNATTELIN